MTGVFRKQYRNLSEVEKSAIEDIKTKAEELFSCFDIIPEADKRMIALAKTNLEQSVMWAVKAIT